MKHSSELLILFIFDYKYYINIEMIKKEIKTKKQKITILYVQSQPQRIQSV